MSEAYICDAVRTPFGRYGVLISEYGGRIAAPGLEQRTDPQSD